MIKWNQEKIAIEIERLGNGLLNDFNLKFGKNECKITELEFYIFNRDFHDDCFTHSDKKQLEYGKLYFHRYGSGLRKGNYKGMDIVFGNENENTFVGVLIRGISDLQNEFSINGPCKIVNYITNELKIDYNYEIISEIETESIFESSSMIKLIKSNRDKEKYLRVPRVGLNKKKKNCTETFQWKDYLFRRYRFLSDFRKTKEKYIAYLSYLWENHPKMLLKGDMDKLTEIVFNELKEFYRNDYSLSKVIRKEVFANRVNSFLKGYNSIKNADLESINLKSANEKALLFGYLSKRY